MSSGPVAVQNPAQVERHRDDPLLASLSLMHCDEQVVEIHFLALQRKDQPHAGVEDDRSNHPGPFARHRLRAIPDEPGDRLVGARGPRSTLPRPSRSRSQSFTQVGTGTVRTRPRLPTRSTMHHRLSGCWMYLSVGTATSDRRSPQPRGTASIARSRSPSLVVTAGGFSSFRACLPESQFPTRTPPLIWRPKRAICRRRVPAPTARRRRSLSRGLFAAQREIADAPVAGVLEFGGRAHSRPVMPKECAQPLFGDVFIPW